MVSSPWGKPGAWALDAEEHDAELQQQRQNNSPAESPAADFPSLAAAAATKQPKKKKNQTLSLAKFATYSSPKPSQEPRGLTHDEILSLPTGPRERSADEVDRQRLGGGFKSYGQGSRNGDDSSNSRWRSGGNGNSRVSRDLPNREFAPSRADEVDDWSKTKKSTAGNGFERRENRSFFESHSKADESDNWVSNKQTIEPPRRFGGSTGGFERRGSFDSLSRDRHVVSNVNGGGPGSDSDNWGRKKEENDIGSGSGGRPKLLLQPRSLPVNNNGNGNVGKTKASSPFGNARPREEVLAEKGLDHKEIDEKLEASKNNGNDNKEKNVEKWKRGDSFGRWSFGSFGSEESWRKADDSVDSGSRPQSADESENDHADQNGLATDDGHTEGN